MGIAQYKKRIEFEKGKNLKVIQWTDTGRIRLILIRLIRSPTKIKVYIN